MVIVTATSRDTRSARQVSRKAIPLQKAHIHDTSVQANTDFLASDLTPSDPVVMFRVQMQSDTAAVFSAMVSDGSTEVTLKFNEGDQLTAGALYIFDLLVHVDDNVNFQVDQAAKIEKFVVHEVLWAVQ